MTTKNALLLLAGFLAGPASAQPAGPDTSKYAAELAFARALFPQIDNGDILASLPPEKRSDVSFIRGQNLIVRYARRQCPGPIAQRVLHQVQPSAYPNQVYLVFQSAVQGWEYKCQEGLLLLRMPDGSVVLERYQTQAAS